MVDNVDAQQYVVPPVRFQSSTIKRQILIGYSLIVTLALPLWWYTTSIQRLSLPIDRVEAIERTNVVFPLNIILKDVTSNVEEFSRALHDFLDQDKSRYPASWEGIKLSIHNSKDFTPPDEATSYTIQFHPEHVKFESRPNMWIHGRTLNIIGDPSSGPLVKSIGPVLCELLAPYKRGSSRTQERTTARYSKTFRLAFSLLAEDFSSGITGIGWDVKQALDRHLYPILDQMKQTHNFTIESQVQFHAPLTFEPPSVTSTTGKTSYVLGEDELKIFINSAEWSLSSSVSEEPVLHFVLFIPSSVHHPLAIFKNTSRDAFIVPQWGGIVILNHLNTMKEGEKARHLEMDDLTNAFTIFQAQLLALLGVPSNPADIMMMPKGQSRQINEWQLDALYRRRTLENLRDSAEALSSIVKLVDQIQNMPVGLDVRDDVENALDAVEKVLSNSMNFSKALHFSAAANELSSRAFFNPGMLALLYFPAEHKYAVYVPLFGPISLPFLLVLFKETKKWLKERRAPRLKSE